MEKRTDLYDSGSGAEFFYSIEPPIHEAGIWYIYTLSHQYPIGKGLTQHTVECKASCTETFMAQSGLVGPGDDEEDDSLSSSSSITVFREKLHMHKLGYSAFLEQYRDGQGLIWTERAQYYDYR